MKRERDHTEFGALIALFAGALSTGGAGILVRLSETGPTATAFWRGCIALPLLAVWALLERPAQRDGGAEPSPRIGNLARVFASFRDPGFLFAGALFAGDLALWHWSLVLTSVAASTLEASLAPIFVAFIAWLRWREQPSAGFMGATALALVGMVLIVSPKFGQAGSAFVGDACGLGTACFFAGYILAVARLRARYGTGHRDVQFDCRFHAAVVASGSYAEISAGYAVGMGDVGGMRVGCAGARARTHRLRSRAPAADIQLTGFVDTNTGGSHLGVAGVG